MSNMQRGDASLYSTPTRPISLKELQSHVTQCPISSSACQAIHSVHVATSSVEVEILGASPSQLRGNIGDQLMGRLMKTRIQDGKLEVKQKLEDDRSFFQHTVASSVSSSAASSRLLNKELKRGWQAMLVCGDADGVRAQEVAGLCRVSSGEQDKLLQEEAAALEH